MYFLWLFGLLHHPWGHVPHAYEVPLKVWRW